MNENHPVERGQSIILVAVAFLALLLFVAITVDISKAYVDRRTAQNAADGAALAGARQLAYQINHNSYNDTRVQEEMNDFGERNGIQDTDGVPGNATDHNVEGYYLDEKEERLRQVGFGTVPNDAWGIEAITYITAPTFFGGVFGLNGLPLNATAAVLLDKACGADCVVPIAAYMMAFTSTATCYNIWNGEGPGNFGWLNWSLQKDAIPCVQGSDTCNTPCLEQNLSPGTCRSGLITVGAPVAGTTGDKNSGQIRKVLKEDYIDAKREFTVVVYETRAGTGCGGPHGGDQYIVAGFARMRLIGYQLSQGGKYDPIIDPAKCVTLGSEPRGGNRLTAKFISWVGGLGGKCKAVGTLRAPRLIK